MVKQQPQGINFNINDNVNNNNIISNYYNKIINENKINIINTEKNVENNNKLKEQTIIKEIKNK